MGDKTYNGACFCGAVEIEVTGQPAVMGYCHCDWDEVMESCGRLEISLGV